MRLLRGQQCEAAQIAVYIYTKQYSGLAEVGWRKTNKCIYNL